MIALRARGEQAFRCWASTGDAPPLGSRLRLNRELAERCSAEGFARVEAASSVAVSNDLSGFTSAVIVTFGPKTAGGGVGIFSREATFGPRDLRNIQLTAHKLAPEDGAELDVPVLVPWFDRRDMAKVAAAAVLVLGVLVVAVGVPLIRYIPIDALRVVVGALLLYEHLIISPGDMRRMNAAFFTLNGVISVVFFGFVAADVLMKR